MNSAFDHVGAFAPARPCLICTIKKDGTACAFHATDRRERARARIAQRHAWKTQTCPLCTHPRDSKKSPLCSQCRWLTNRERDRERYRQRQKQKHEHARAQAAQAPPLILTPTEGRALTLTAGEPQQPE